MKWCLIATVILLSQSIGCAQQVSRKNFDRLLLIESSNIEKLVKSKDSWALYKLSPILESYNQMYLATGDKIYLSNALSLINKIIDNSSSSYGYKSSQFKDSYKSWINKSHEEKGDDGKEYPLFESYLWRYVTYTLFLIKNDGLYATFKNDYDKILSFTENNIFAKWKSRGMKNIYRENTNMFALWAHICLNLWRLTSNKIYLQVCDDFKKEFYKNIIVNKKNNTIFWNSFFNKRKWDKKGQDVLHANAEVSFIIDAYKDGFYDYSLITQLINTLNLVVIKSNGSTAMYLDGSGNSKGRILDGFMKLGRFDQSLQMRLKEMSFYSPSEYHKEILHISTLLANDKLLKNQL